MCMECICVKDVQALHGLLFEWRGPWPMQTSHMVRVGERWTIHGTARRPSLFRKNPHITTSLSSCSFFEVANKVSCAPHWIICTSWSIL